MANLVRFFFFLVVRLFFIPPCKNENDDEVLDLSGVGGTLFVLSTPRVIGPVSMGSGALERRGSMNTEAPLLGPVMIVDFGVALSF